eukprot:3748438-Amphidinium_carterae.1
MADQVPLPDCGREELESDACKSVGGAKWTQSRPVRSGRLGDASVQALGNAFGDRAPILHVNDIENAGVCIDSTEENAVLFV